MSHNLVKYKGVFKRQIGLLEGVSLIIGSTVGAGVLSIPFVIARVGVPVGMVYIVVIGLLMMCLNLLVGELSARTGQNLQMVGFARLYLGDWAGFLMTVIMYLSMFGTLVVYIIGEGQTLQALFGGGSLIWSIIFFFVASVPVIIGMGGVKRVELIIIFSILFILLIISLSSATKIEYSYLTEINLFDIFLPYGVLLFAFSGANGIPEAYSLMKKDKDNFKKAIIISGLLVMVVYALFAFVVVGVTGPFTTEIATIGLGMSMGKFTMLLGNIFASLAMCTGFIMTATALRDSLCWDFRASYRFSTFIVLFVPILIFLSGTRGFVAMIEVIGGVFFSLQVLLFLLIYWRAKQVGHWPRGRFGFHHTSLLLIVLVFIFTIGGIYSIINLF